MALGKELTEMILESFTKDNDITIEDLKQFIEKHENKPIKTTEYYDDAQTKIKLEKWQLNDKLHREDGPAYIKYYEDGTTEAEIYYINGKEHREERPAAIYFHENCEIKLQKYFINGELHNMGEPAYIEYCNLGCLLKEIYYENNKKIKEIIHFC